MIIRHATPTRNLKSIRRQGLLKKLATGRKEAVWLHTPSKSAWGVLHTTRRHKVAAADVTVLELSVPAEWMKRSGKTGLWYCCRDIPASRIIGQYSYDELAASPCEAVG